jgi:hypothetical protein
MQGPGFGVAVVVCCLLLWRGLGPCRRGSECGGVVQQGSDAGQIKQMGSVGIDIQPQSPRDTGSSFASIFVSTAQKRCRRNRRRSTALQKARGSAAVAVSRFGPSGSSRSGRGVPLSHDRRPRHMTPSRAASALRQTSRLSRASTWPKRHATCRPASILDLLAPPLVAWTPLRGFTFLPPPPPSHLITPANPHPDNPHARPETLRGHNPCTRAFVL